MMIGERGESLSVDSAKNRDCPGIFDGPTDIAVG